MAFSYVIRRRFAQALVLTILFTQFAIAAHACSARPATADVLPCAEMAAVHAALDTEQPGLCQQHCQQGSAPQPADHNPVVPLPLPALVALFMLIPSEPPAAISSRWAAHERRRDHAPPLAHSILHCCYRI